ncbi:hypothetical protein DL546_009257 [Coniochaeta pulveracea]|uniref:Uncharacterized protein n=1 Tax=Coniochaeta pulveracea TaxID=177199 RepID=A0A420YGV5_9PEZI|nr:hypothetical protein DL546_009257 [Coniochaeta pulveracea]
MRKCLEIVARGEDDRKRTSQAVTPYEVDIFSKKRLTESRKDEGLCPVTDTKLSPNGCDEAYLGEWDERGMVGAIQHGGVDFLISRTMRTVTGSCSIPSRTWLQPMELAWGQLTVTAGLTVSKTYLVVAAPVGLWARKLMSLPFLSQALPFPAAGCWLP